MDEIKKLSDTNTELEFSTQKLLKETNMLKEMNESKDTEVKDDIKRIKETYSKQIETMNDKSKNLEKEIETYKRDNSKLLNQ
mmetsp:Transcript_29112/g.25757  ORF Transcript_29112/g.25757 Transcript_29112/m.25757 type:complete len:82 (+) Transcript_29112:1-246(+)